VTREKHRRPEFHFRDHPYQPQRWLPDGTTTEYGDKFGQAAARSSEPSRREQPAHQTRPAEAPAEHTSGSEQPLEARPEPVLLASRAGLGDSRLHASEQTATDRRPAQDSLDLLQQRLREPRPAPENYQVFKKP